MKRVAAFTGQAFAQRTITSAKKNGTVIPVEVPTHVAGILETHSGVMVNLIMSFDVAGHHLPRIELHGTAGSLVVPDPNSFQGEVQLRKFGEKEWQDIALDREPGQRAAGAADMMRAIETGRPHRCTGDLAMHVLDIMESLHKSGETGSFIDVQSTCEQPSAVPKDIALGEFD